MKNLPTILTMCALVLLRFEVFAQNQLVLCDDKKAELLESGKNLVVDYSRLIEVLSMETDFEIQNKIKDKIYQLAEKRDIQVEDDLTDYSHQGRRFTLDNYLTNIHYNVSEGGEVYYEVGEPADVYYQSEQGFYYTIVEAKKNVKRPEGTAMYLRNFYVKIDQIDKNLPILRISDITMKRPTQSFIGISVPSTTCLREVKPLAFDMAATQVFTRDNDVPYNIEWQGGILEDSLVIELVEINKKGDLISKDTIINSYQNKGYYTQWSVDKKKAGMFKLRMTKMHSTDPPVWSETFKIKRKIPLAYKIAVPAAVVIGGYFVIKNLGETETLPEPADLPSN